MKAFLFPIFLVLSSTFRLFSQDLIWEKIFGAEPGAFYSVKTDFEGNFITTGRSDTLFGSAFANRGVTMKLDEYGTTIWRSDILEVNGLAAGTVSHDLVFADDVGSIVITGHSIFQDAPDGGLLVRQYSTDGQIAWDKRYSFGNHVVSGGCIAKTTDGGYIIAGTYDNSLFLMKSDINGDSTWLKVYSYFFPYSDAMGQWSKFYGKILETDDNGYIFCYTSQVPATSMSVIRFNSYGDTLWTRNYNQGQASMGNSITRTPDGNYLICGSQTNSFISDANIIKIDLSGNILSDKSYDQFGFSDEFSSLVMDAEGNSIAAGFTTQVYATYQEMGYVVKTNSAGDTIWSAVDGEGTYATAERIFDIDLTENNGTILCGSAGGHPFLTRLNSDGGGFVGIPDSPEDKYDKIIYVRGNSLFIDLSKSTNRFNKLNLTITNMAGINLKQLQISGSQILTININDLPLGAYLLSVKTETTYETLKFLKQ